MTDKTSTKASALLTAESVIIAFLFAYAPVFSSTLVTLIRDKEPFVTTVWAGLVIFGLILTGFRSIILLFESIDELNDEKYRAGKELFFTVILGSSLYAVAAIGSILNSAVTGVSFYIPKEMLFLPVPFLAVWVLWVWCRPFTLTRPVFLSFLFVGLGQIYNRQIGKGVLLIILGFICGGLMFVFIGFIIAYTLLWIYGIYDACKTGKTKTSMVKKNSHGR